jgi:hypothetical protein
MRSLQQTSIALCNGIDPSLCRGSDTTVSAYTTTQPIHERGRWSEEWANCTDYRCRTAASRHGTGRYQGR